MNFSGARKAIERTYEDTCDVYAKQDYLDGSITRQRDVPVYRNLKCALSQKLLTATNQTVSANEGSYVQKLFLAPEIVIPQGSRVKVRRFGREYFFQTAGEP
ncbi:MAG: ABC transporter ATP-binding protein, partial [Defluviitaleaceae bacterium]|nr:ABC transporter ATP-binding protein [Defluviitaleaceae bacterium]